MQKTICDRCGEEIKVARSKTLKKFEVTLEEVDENADGSFGSHEVLKREMCPSCATAVRKAIEFVINKGGL